MNMYFTNDYTHLTQKMYPLTHEPYVLKLPYALALALARARARAHVAFFPSPYITITLIYK